MPPRKRRTPKGERNATKNEAPLETPAGALATDEGGRPLIDPETGLPIVAGQEVATDEA